MTKKSRDPGMPSFEVPTSNGQIQRSFFYYFWKKSVFFSWCSGFFFSIAQKIFQISSPEREREAMIR